MVAAMNLNPNAQTETDLLERYLQAIGHYLPNATRDDTLAELRANLLEQMDARAEELGRPLTALEVSDILRTHGRPEVVAVRYLPQRSLIGPGFFPIYLLTLKRALPFVILIYCAAQLLPLVLSRGSHVHVSEIVAAVLQLIPTLFIFWGVVTIVFALLDVACKQNAGGHRWPSYSPWDPGKLPAVVVEVNGIKPRSLASRIADLVVHCFWMLYVLAIPANPFLLIGPGESYLESHGIRFAPVWHTFYVLLIALLLVQLLMKSIATVHQYQASLRPLQLIINLLSFAATGIMAAAAEYFVPTSSAANLATLATVNHGMTIAFRIAFIFAVAGLFVDSWKLIKRRIPTHRVAF